MPNLYLDSLYRQSLPEDVLNGHNEIQIAADQLTAAIEELTPESSERRSALRKIREATEQAKSASAGIAEVERSNASVVVNDTGYDFSQSEEEMDEMIQAREEEIQTSIANSLIAPLQEEPEEESAVILELEEESEES